MTERILLALVSVLVTTNVSAGEYGTRDEAKALLDKVVADMKQDKAGTLAKITKSAYNDRDLYPFCSGPDGKIVAHGGDKTRIGVVQADVKDVSGKPFGVEIRNAETGKISEVSYLYKRPNTDERVPKVTLVTKVDDHICGVGYYAKQK